MTDTVSKKRRSEIMKNVKGKHTKPELLVRKFLFSKGFRFRIHDKKLPGKPDIKLTKYKTVIFVNGCFWHGHQHCNIYVMPKSNIDFWNSKIERNINRDEVTMKNLKELGWNVIILWECSLKKRKIENTLNEVVEKLLSLSQ
ncbi:very short patch repair endonuclease [Mucilaginibacter sp.]|uniref:very short patch repair endonuclease n=1 Tax=Mucilaginibacter sp. TaxID=1882438 RepID=UPI0035BBBA18